MRLCHLLLCVLATAVAALAGCGSSGPKTYPVNGKVVPAKPEDLTRLQGLGIELQSTAEPTTRAFGQLKADGSFTVTTYRLGETPPGAIEGTHKARLQIEVGEDEPNRVRKKIAIDKKYTRFETSPWQITVPTTGEVVLQLQ